MDYFTTHPITQPTAVEAVRSGPVISDPSASRQLLELKTEKAVQSQINGFLVGFSILALVIVGAGLLLCTSNLGISKSNKEIVIINNGSNNKVHLMNYWQKLNAKINYNMEFLPIRTIFLSIILFPLYFFFLFIRAAYWSQADQNYYESRLLTQRPTVTSGI